MCVDGQQRQASSLKSFRTTANGRPLSDRRDIPAMKGREMLVNGINVGEVNGQLPQPEPCRDWRE